MNPTQMHSLHNVLVTGGAGFIGSNFLRFLLAHNPSLSVVNLDLLTYAGHPANVEDLEADYRNRYTFARVDIRDALAVRRVLDDHGIDTIVHVAAETHVDRSIDAPSDFVTTNLVGTAVLLEQAQSVWGNRDDVRFHHVSTDEVYGSAAEGQRFVEGSRYDPSSPYAASKAGSDHLVQAWHRTYGLATTQSNCSNNYGPYQFPEKLIPLMIRKAQAREPLPIYGDGGHVRDWLHVEDHCRALDRIVREGCPGAQYNVGSGTLLSNLHVVQQICDLLDTSEQQGDPRRALITHVADRAGHDRRYAVNDAKLRRELDWRPKIPFNLGLRQTVAWYLDHETWCRRVTKGRYAGERLGTRQ